MLVKVKRVFGALVKIIRSVLLEPRIPKSTHDPVSHSCKPEENGEENNMIKKCSVSELGSGDCGHSEPNPHADRPG